MPQGKPISSLCCSSKFPSTFYLYLHFLSFCRNLNTLDHLIPIMAFALLTTSGNRDIPQHNGSKQTRGGRGGETSCPDGQPTPLSVQRDDDSTRRIRSLRSSRSRMKKNQPFFDFTRLSHEVLMSIFKFCDPISLFQLMEVCKTFHRILKFDQTVSYGKESSLPNKL